MMAAARIMSNDAGCFGLFAATGPQRAMAMDLHSPAARSTQIHLHRAQTRTRHRAVRPFMVNFKQGTFRLRRKSSHFFSPCKWSSADAIRADANTIIGD
jgi:hypothetical protein